MKGQLRKIAQCGSAPAGREMEKVHYDETKSKQDQPL